MIVRYKYGFKYMGKVYVWKDKELIRMPFESGKMCFGKKKVAKWIVNGKHYGFVLGNIKKSFSQLEFMTEVINYENNEFEINDMPFQ